MAHATDNKAHTTVLVLLTVLASLGSGCGREVSRGSKGGFGSTLASRLVDEIDEMDGPNVELTTYTSCESIDGVARSRCAGIRSAGVEAFFDGRSLVFDFSNAPSNGSIAEEGFEGYVLALTEGSHLSAIIDAFVDETESTVGPDAVVIELDDTAVSIDLGGLPYDDTTFVKIDLVFEGA